MNMKRFMNKKVAAIGLAAGLALGAAGIAAAYFTSTGNGTGSASVGTATNWSVVQASSTGTMYPCGATPLTAACSTDQATVTYTITNNSSGNQLLTYSDLQTAIDNDGGSPANILTGGTNHQSNADTYSTSNLTGFTAVSGCQSGWFGSEVDSLNGAQANVDVAASGTATVVVTVGLEDANAVQNNCELQTPDVDLWVG
jgi:hypothetical protein